jgi:uncharacterized membrane protein YccC
MPSMDGRDVMPAGDAAARPAASEATADAVTVAASTTKPKRATRILQRAPRLLQRAQRKQQRSAAARENTGATPGLGALNRQLELLIQQLGAAHRVLGRVSAERDALRQQLADLQGIPVEEIVVPSVGASSEEPPVAHERRPEHDGARAAADGRVARIRRRRGR